MVQVQDLGQVYLEALTKSQQRMEANMGILSQADVAFTHAESFFLQLTEYVLCPLPLRGTHA